MESVAGQFPHRLVGEHTGGVVERLCQIFI
jgi:hypothetical protein